MREKEPATRIIYVRHGKTDFPLNRIYCDDREDPPLNTEGRQQAEKAAGLLVGMPVDAVYASPMSRTGQTAETIAKNHELSVDYRDGLKERHFGIWEGLYFDQVQTNYPDLFNQWKQNPAKFKPEGGESMAELQHRLNTAMADIMNRHLGQTVVVVSHVGPIRVRITEAMDMPIETHRYVRIDYASLTRLDYGRSKINLIYLNYLSELPTS